VKLPLAIVQIRLEMAEIELLTGKKVHFSKQGKPGYVFHQCIIKSHKNRDFLWKMHRIPARMKGFARITPKFLAELRTLGQ